MSFPIRKHLMKGKVYWLLDLRSVGQGRKVFSTRDEAKRHGELVQSEQSRFGSAVVTMDPAERVAVGAALKRLEPFGVRLADVVSQWIEQCAGQPGKTTDEALTECLADKERTGKRDRTIQQYGYTFESLRKSLPKSLAAIRSSDVESWLLRDEWSLATRKSQLSHAEAFFSWCVAKGFLRRNPCDGLESISLEDRRPGILTVEQVQKLFTVCRENSPAFLPYFALTIFAGIRPQEVFRLSWDKVDLDQGHAIIESEDSKTRQRRIVTLQPNAVAWLKLKGDLPPINWQRTFDRVRALAGITQWPHDAARHSFCSYSLPIRGAAATALDAGHSETILFRHYRELVTRQDAERFWAIKPEERKE